MLDITEDLYGQRYYLCGSFIDVPPIVSTFATPIFQVRGDNTRQRYVQSIDQSGFVSVFLPTNIDDELDLIPIGSLNFEMHEGDAALYAFHGPAKGVVTYGNQSQMRRFLRSNLQGLNHNKFTYFEVLQFLGLFDQAMLLFPAELPKEEIKRLEKQESDLLLACWTKLAYFFFELSAMLGISPVAECAIEVSGSQADALSSRLRPEAIIAMEKVGNSYNNLGPHKTVQMKGRMDPNLETTIAYFSISSAERRLLFRGTVFSDGLPRICEIDGMEISCHLMRNMLFLWCKNIPGLIGTVGMTLGKNNLNIVEARSASVPEGAAGLLAFSFSEQIPEQVASTLRRSGLFSRVLNCNFQFVE